MSSVSTSSRAVLTISQDPSIVTVIERFKVPANRKEEAIDIGKNHISQTWINDPDFIGAALLRGRDHDGISCYAQWKRSGGNMTPDAPPASQSMSALSTFKLLESRTFSMDFTEHAQAEVEPTQISMEKTLFVHYGLFSVKPENQNRVVDLGRGNSTQSMGTPGLLSISWHRSLDGKMIVNLGTWSNFDGLEQLSHQEGFKLDSDEVYWKGWADWKAELFDVVAVETRK